MLFKVLGSIIYFIIDKYVCLYYLCIQKEKYLFSWNNFRIPPLMIFLEFVPMRYWWTSFIFMDLNKRKEIYILTCCSKLVLYYISKGFVIIENESNVLKNVHLKEKQQINATDKHPNDYAMTRNRYILYVVNTLKNNHLNYNLFS